MEEVTSTPNQKTLEHELIRGRDCTKKLQCVLRRRAVDDGLVSTEDLVNQIIGSFSDSLSTFSSYVGSDDLTLKSGERGKKLKDRRGCYKKRQKTEVSRVEIAKTYEDEHVWRKYGQKEIQNAKFPRCYYRCTYKDEGCKALKQVQKLENGSQMFRITYFGSHTCQNMNRNTQMFSDSGDHSLFLINFEDSRIKQSPNSLPTITNAHTAPSFNQDDNSNARNGDYYLASNSHGTSSSFVWKGMISNSQNDDYLAYNNYGTSSNFVWDNMISNSQNGEYITSNSHGTSSNYVWEDMINNTQNGDHLASNRYGTSSDYAWEDMISNMELSYDDIFKDDVYTDIFKF